MTNKFIVGVCLFILSNTPSFAKVSDGCSVGISKAWRFWLKQPPPFEACCVIHDKAYWKGGTSNKRALADKNLYLCVRKYDVVWASVMLIGVKIGGQPFFPFDWNTSEIDYSHEWWYGRND